MPYKCTNTTSWPKAMNLTGGNAVHLLPFGTKDDKGKRLDQAVILDEELDCPDVQNFMRAEWITVEKMADAPAGAPADDAKAKVKKPA